MRAVIFFDAHVADPAHLVSIVLPEETDKNTGGPRMLSGSRWQRFLISLLGRSIKNAIQK